MAEQEWVTTAEAALAGLAGPHLAKKRATIIALVDAHLAGKSEESVWRLPEACSRRIYHQKWKFEPTFIAALAAVDGLARDWKDSRALRALQQAAERLALASPVAAAKAIALLAAADQRVQLQAAFGILDRAGMETASKSSVAAEVKQDVEFNLGKLDDAELDALERIARRFAEHSDREGTPAPD